MIERSGESFRARVLNSPGGQATATFTMPFSAMERENILLKLRPAARGTRRVDSPETALAKSFGDRLYQAVFSGDIGARLHASLGLARSQRAGLRIRLRLTDVPELAGLPWEFLYDRGLNRFLARSVDTPLVRFLDLPATSGPLPVSGPIRILGLVSSPRDYPALDADREWIHLQDSLEELRERNAVIIERLAEPTLQGLLRALRRSEYHVFHFIGHGGFHEHADEGILLFEDSHGRSRPVSGQDLGVLLHDHHTMRLAVLNACEGARGSIADSFSGTAQSLVQGGIPAVVAMQFEITDEAAITFGREFYSAIADGYPVDAALGETRKAILAEGSGLEWGTPVLYMRSEDGHIFDVESASAVSSSAAAAQTAPARAIPVPIADVHYREGVHHYEKRNFDGAIAAFRKALRLEPGNAQTHNALGDAFWDKGQKEDAIAEFQEAARLGPGYVEAHNNLAITLQDAGRLDAALAASEYNQRHPSVGFTPQAA